MSSLAWVDLEPRAGLALPALSTFFVVASAMRALDIPPDTGRSRAPVFGLLLPIIPVGLWALTGITTPFMQYAMGASAILMADTGLRPITWVAILPLGIVLGYWWLPHPVGGIPGLSPTVAGLGAMALFIGGPALRWADPIRAKRAIWAGIFPAAIALSILVRVTLGPQAPSYDLWMAYADQQLVGPLAFRMGQWFQGHPWIRAFHVEVYLALPFAMAWAFIGNGSRWGLVRLFVTAGIAGMLCYHLIPVGGPLETFSDYPVTRIITPPLHRTTLSWGELTGFPSLHFAWALLVAASAWQRGPWIRWLGVAFVVFTASATLGLGMHWLVDLLASLPFTWLLWRTLSLRPSIKRVEIPKA
jgi:hypothetical protein